MFNGITVAFYVSRRHTNLADVPSGVSQIIIKLSFGNVKRTPCMGDSGFQWEMVFCQLRSRIKAGGDREGKMPGSQTCWVQGNSLPFANFLLLFQGSSSRPCELVPPLTHSMKLSMKEACSFRQFRISPLLKESFTLPFTPVEGLGVAVLNDSTAGTAFKRYSSCPPHLRLLHNTALSPIRGTYSFVAAGQSCRFAANITIKDTNVNSS